jgi:Mrp family chromosome partitioning ATPase
MQRKGFQTAILDADITGPSIRKRLASGKRRPAVMWGFSRLKAKRESKSCPSNLLLPNETDPVVWRGTHHRGYGQAVLDGRVWNDVDFYVYRYAPGDRRRAAYRVQSIPVDGIVIVTSPQELVSMIVSKAVKMAQMMNIPGFGDRGKIWPISNVPTAARSIIFSAKAPSRDREAIRHSKPLPFAGGHEICRGLRQRVDRAF